jgi:Ser/Thr protein kinase RdoA (MazF antagonist)
VLSLVEDGFVPGSLGEKIGEGAVSDVHTWAPGQVVKLFKAGFPRRLAAWETRMTRAAHAAGLPAPEVFDEVSLDGRTGIVLTRFEGPTLRRLSQTGALSRDQVGAVLAALAVAVHRTRPPTGAISLRDQTEGLLRSAGHRLPAYIGAGLLPLIDRLSPGDGLCHCDLHAGNVIMTETGPRLIDWTGMLRAPAAYDLAICRLIHREFIHPSVSDPERLRGVDKALEVDYARLTGAAPTELAAAVEAYVPLACASALLISEWPETLKMRMVTRIEAATTAASD